MVVIKLEANCPLILHSGLSLDSCLYLSLANLESVKNLGIARTKIITAIWGLKKTNILREERIVPTFSITPESNPINSKAFCVPILVILLNRSLNSPFSIKDTSNDEYCWTDNDSK